MVINVYPIRVHGKNGVVDEYITAENSAEAFKQALDDLYEKRYNIG